MSGQVQVVNLGFRCMNVLADWHHSHGGGPSSPPTPEDEAFFVAAACVIFVGLGLSALNIFGGGLLVFLTARKRDAFWIVPLVNFVVYVAAVLLRPHPLGFQAQFRGWSLVGLVVEFLIILLAALAWVTVLTLIRAAFQKLRALGKRRSTGAPQAPVAPRT
jgi:hypothetical protein